MIGEEIDDSEFCRMIDTFIERGFNYFDTAHGYHNGLSETALRRCLTSRYPRESYLLTNKLSSTYFKTEEEIRPFFEKQLERCGVEYFDFYLMHAQDKRLFEKYKQCRAYETAIELKKEGKIKHFGLSFHDKAEVLDRILTAHPEIEVVQIQFNYVDYDDPKVESFKCYQVCEKHDKPVLIMEPVKGGNLVDLPDEGKNVLDELGGGSYASYAIRFAASFPKVFMVLSGMSTLTQVEENVSFMEDFKPLSEKEFEAVEKVREIVKKQDSIACTGCAYCVEGCPKQILIPDLFKDYNDKMSRSNMDVDSDANYRLHTDGHGKASDCIKCGKCEKECPQHLEIRELLKKTAEAFEM
jgi:predicted aldo/keto reductase-like oxidoreductase